ASTAIRRLDPVEVIVQIHYVRQQQLLLIVDALSAAGLLFGSRERGQQHPSQNGDDRNHNQQFDQRESGSLSLWFSQLVHLISVGKRQAQPDPGLCLIIDTISPPPRFRKKIRTALVPLTAAGDVATWPFQFIAWRVR